MADDFTSNTSTTGILVPGGQAVGTYESSKDSDWFKITLTAENVYRFELNSAGNPYFGSFHGLKIYNSEGAYLSSLSGINDYTPTARYGAYKPAASGTYYVEVRDTGGSFANTVPYTLKASAGEPDDAGDAIATAKAAILGEPIQGAFESIRDVDRYKLTLEAGTTYTISANWGEAVSGLYPANQLTVENAASDTMADGTNPATMSFTTTGAGDYYLAAHADSRARTAATSYTLTAVKAVDDYVASPATTGQLAIQQTLNGELETGHDRDWFAARLNAGATYWFTLDSRDSFTGLPSSAVIRLLDADGKEVAAVSGSSFGGSGKLVLPYTPTTAGAYYAEVKDMSSTRIKYTIGLSPGLTDDYTGNRADATAVPVNSTWNGKLEVPQDQDAVKIAVTKGQTYLFELQAVAPLDEPFLAMRGSPFTDAFTSSLSNYQKPGLAGYGMFRADYTGDFYLSVYNTRMLGTSGYAVRIVESPADDVGNEAAASAALLPIGGKVTGALDYTGDVDWFKVTLQGGAKYAFSLRGAGTGEGTLVTGFYDAGLQMREASTGNDVYPQSVSGGNHVLNVDTGGDYYIGVSKNAFDNTGNDGTGTYTLHATALSADVTAPKVAAIGSASGAAAVSPIGDVYVTFDEPVIVNFNAMRLKSSLGEIVEWLYSDSTSLLSNGTVLKFNPSNTLKPGAKYFLELGAGAVTDLVGNNYAGPKLVAFNTVAPVEKGGAGSDFLVGLAAALQLDGGAGVDTVMYAGSRASYTIGNGATESRVHENDVPEQADILTHVERLLFSDTAVALDVAGAGGQAYRLYQAAFNRAPDKAGLGFWIAQLDKGIGLHDVAQAFIGSQEYTAKYGAATSNAAFVTTLYQNVLHRAGDTGGVTFWNDMLDKGVSRAGVLAAFSESPENQAAVLQVIGNGFEYTPYG